MVWYDNQLLLDWLQSFVLLVNKFLKAKGVDTLDDDEAKNDDLERPFRQTDASILDINDVDVWSTTLDCQRDPTYQAPQRRWIKRLSEGEFKEKTLQKLVTKLSSNFEPYKQDKAVLLYLICHLSQIRKTCKAALTNQSKENRIHSIRKESASRIVVQVGSFR